MAATRVIRSALRACLLACVWTTVAAAAELTRGVSIFGGVQSQNIVRHPAVDELHFIQQRNTVRLGVRWDAEAGPPALAWLWRDGPLRDVRGSLLYRAVYDSVYDFTPTFRERDLRGRKPGRAADRDLGDLSARARAALAFESDLREAWLDVRLRRHPVRLRIGQQQIVWGEADLFRMLDRANPLDTTWHFIEEIPPPAFGWDDLRIPLWMLTARAELGRAGLLADLAVELYWNPGDWRPAKVAFLPRPWGIRLLHPLTNREDGAFLAPFAAQRLAHSSLFDQGDYRRTPLENSQLGIRLAAVLPRDLRVGLYYFHQRWAGDDGTPFAPLRGIPDDLPGRVRTHALIQRGTLPVEYIAPYVHTVGVSASHFEPAVQATLRLETVYDFALPLFDRARTTTLSPFLPGTVERDYWKAMLGVDRAVTIPALNRTSSVFLTAQWFVHHLLGHRDTLTGPLDLPTAGGRPRRFCGSGPTEPCTDPDGDGSFRDDLHAWESLATMAAFTSYRGGTVTPVAGCAIDPVNSFSTNVFWSVDWILGHGFTVNMAQRYFWSAQGDGRKGPFDPWLIGTMRGRSETALRLTWVF